MVWSAGAALTAAQLNANAPQEWTAYTPAWSSTGTAPSLGNGSLSGRGCRSGDSAEFYFEWRAGSTTTFGTSSYRWTLPYTCVSHTVPTALGGWVYGENAGSTGYMFFPRFVSTTTFELVYHSIAVAGAIGGVVGQTTPFTWGDGDFVRGYVTYEAA